MKITKTFFSVFLTAFLIGFVSTTKRETFVSIRTGATTPEKISAAANDRKIEQKSTEEAPDRQEEDTSKLKIKLLETGEAFHGDQIKAKTGEIWLGLFKEKDKYLLRPAKLKIRRVRDGIADDEDKNIKTGKSVFTNYKSRAVFLLKNATMLREGEIRTVFWADDIDESTELKNDSQKDFEFNGEHYSLKVENKMSSDESLGKGSKLVLSRSGTTQVLNYLKDGCNDCYWNLYWVGDLDRDGKLDFYLDLSWHYNVMDKRLFLSSQAEKGKLVKYVADFFTNGC